ncbi:MAG: Twitching motility protein [Candidatus Woesebacteria bacterium GW2011_GWA1_33_30]|uniref:Twitching motility protein n=1 Tax=Candidatus Woesebacteria bacterium GW2011_GWA2_33_28 TaxID=1618561 RepID=A0A0F9ZUW8_9BACT|nr:MAG: Twitching motility protein [Candidatus Woesebacteria bacterium GW2011_GWA2_33_28]KKP48857.1 MAG: Twitching motility protein [Candidatus Woesebacteria bacterium GW2011_GWA1_33_30]KKP50130.1 MAG: Twitching motility protein [Microgenomates group bacterium GW2011_GWC1_33_32]KKP51900.1 MAG: Twitching motility protein [Candidatus Woesebacteria bacterium GW2011_GWB1_33_38]KKP57336.1 MAG: Twitching motility protein [Microgenomates group bacterium GW2011_GWD1_33_9]
MIDVNNLLQQTIELNASDLHLIVGSPPTIRIEGELKVLANSGILTPENILEGLKQTLTGEQFERLNVNKEIDFSLSFSEKARFRVNAYTQKGSLAVAFRSIPLIIPEIENLGLPKIVHNFTNLRQGLVLVTGPTGHGKSTTLAAILNEINKTRSCHIVTIEDPIEFLFKPIRSIISQREMRSDTHSWQVALRSVLREDPDVVLIGEMRDFETIASAITIAETGHLVFATLHTNSAAQTVDRIVDVFPEEQQSQVRLQLSSVLEAVFSQRLVSAIPKGRVVAHEIMLGTTAIKTAIREGKTHQIDSIIQTSLEVGMFTLEHSLASLVKTNKISLEIAQSWSVRPEELNRLIRGSI